MSILKWFLVAIMGTVSVGVDPAYGCSCACCKSGATAPAGAQPTQGSAAKTMQVSLAISGMSCAGCAAKVQKALMGVPGVQQAHVDVKTGKAVVTADEAKCDEKAMVKAVEQAGYGAKVVK